MPSAAKLNKAIESLCAQAAETPEDRRMTMAQIGHFANFFGTVLPQNEDSCKVKPYPLIRKPVDRGYLLGLLPVQAGFRHSVSIAESDFHTRGHGFYRRTDLLLHPDGQLHDPWGSGLPLASLEPIPLGERPQQRLVIGDHGVGDMRALAEIRMLADVVLTLNGLPPYPGFPKE